MQSSQQSSPFIHSDRTISQLMNRVFLALAPAFVALLLLTGWGVFFQLLLCIVTALLCEAIMLKLRQRPITFFLKDGSVLVTAALLGLAIPSLAPWWVAVVGTGFAIVVVKQLYGGLGFNLFNPAMAGYALLLISFPMEMSQWPFASNSAGFSEAFNTIFLAGQNIDSFTAATPLDILRTGLIMGESSSTLLSNLGNSWTVACWVNLALLAGGLWLLFRGLIQWQIPAGILGSIAVTSLIGNLYNGDQFAGPIFHLLSGSTMMAAFFIATDPVTASTTPKGRIIFGIGIGLLIWLIRSFGGYPDGVAFAVLLMNMSAPLLDHYTQPKVFGH